MLPHRSSPGPQSRETAQPGYRSWLGAWVDAAYGSDGFWTRERPADHFRTGAATGALVARAVAALADEDPRLSTVVDVGAGDGALLEGLAAVAPGLSLVGVDRRPRPPGLHPAVRWQVDHFDVVRAAWTHGGPAEWLDGVPGAPLLVAHEWLDDLPAPVVQRGVQDGAAGWVEVEVAADGSERAGVPVGPVDAAWAARWWPVGRRAELGTTRDAAWTGLVSAALRRGGRALAVDYGHRAGDRPAAGTLVAYAHGRRHDPRPDPGLNLTAHVAVDALAAAGEAVGAVTLRLARQRSVLQAVLGAAPDQTPDPLRTLVRRSEHAALVSPRGGGGLWWLLQGRPFVG